MLFTVILDYDGINSVSQFSASSPEGALWDWQQNLDNPAVYGLKSDQAQALRNALDGARKEHMDRERIAGKVIAFVRAVDGMTNVWCAWLSVQERSAFVNIIATEIGRSAHQN